MTISGAPLTKTLTCLVLGLRTADVARFLEELKGITNSKNPF